jgi:hypothetical protein
MSQSVHQLVRNQILFREVNERLREIIGSHEGPTEFLCECSREDCIHTVTLALPEYERVRARPNLFLVAAGHELLDVERVVGQEDRYVLVEKTVDEGRVIRADPRSREREH